MKATDYKDVKAYLSELLPQTGELLMSHFIDKNFYTKSKGGMDFATQADYESDEFLRKNLFKEFPTTSFLTEETASEAYSQMQNIQNLWIIDPLDGTINFSRGNPQFAISVALVSNSIPMLGAIYLPAFNKFYWADILSENATCDGEKIHVSTTSQINKVVGALDWSWEIQRNSMNVNLISNICGQTLQTRIDGCAAKSMCDLSQSTVDFYFSPGLKPWDVAAGAIIIQKSGGKITKADGTEWNVFDSDIFASNGLLHNELLSFFKN